MRASLLRSLPLVALVAGCFEDSPGANSPDVPDAASTDAVAVDRPAVDAGHLDGGGSDAGPDATADVTRDASSSDVAITTDAPDASSGTDAAQDCVGRPAACVSGTAGGTCGDALTPPICEAGSWRCPDGMIPVTSCACIGRPPGVCTCTPTGWRCGDAGL